MTHEQNRTHADEAAIRRLTDELRRDRPEGLDRRPGPLC
jgi:hypothetical protein